MAIVIAANDCWESSGHMNEKYADELGEELLGCGNGSIWIKKE